MSEFLKKWGNYKAPDTPLRSVPESESESEQGGGEDSIPSLSDMMRTKDPDKKVMDFYLNQQEQEEAKVKSSSTTEDILNFVDNIQRPFYSVMSGLHEGIKSAKFEDESFDKTLSDVGDAMVKGWKREEKKDSRDIARLINPKSVDWIEKNTTIKVFSRDALNPDAGTVPFLASDIVLDPVTYIPFGLPLKMAGMAIKTGNKAIRGAASKIVGEEAVEAITKGAHDLYIKKIAPITNVRDVFKEHGVEELFDTLKHAEDFSKSHARDVVLKASTVSEKNGIFMKVQKIMDEDQAVKLNEAMQKMNDEGVAVYGKLWADELGVSVEGLTKLQLLDASIAAVGKAETRDQAQAALARLSKEFKDQGVDASKYITRGLLEDRGIRRFVNKIAGAESKATEELAMTKLSEASKLRNLSRQKIAQQMTYHKTALKAGGRATAENRKAIIQSSTDALVSLSKQAREIESQYVKKHAEAMASIRMAKKEAGLRQGKYYQAFRALQSGSKYQSFLQKNAKLKEDIFEKGLKELPEELHGPAKAFRQVYDDYMEKGMKGDDPFLKGTSPLYAPREIQKKFLEEVTGKVPQFASGGKGFLKKRKFAKYDEFRSWVESNGGKTLDDSSILLMKYVKDFELNYAKHNVRSAIANQFNGEVPVELQRSLNWMFNGGRSKFENPVAEAAFSMYGKALNASKVALTVINPAFHGRNFLGFPLLSATTAGMKHGLNPFNYRDAFRVKFGKKPGFITDKSGKKISHEEIRQGAEESGYFGASFTGGDVEVSGKMVLDRYGWNNPKRWMGEVFKFSMHSEDVGRYGALIANLKAGKPMKEALESAKSAMFDYNLINSPIDKALQGVFGFYTFSRKNAPQQVKTILNDPKQYAITAKILGKVSNRESLTDEELSLMDSWENETFKIFGDVVDGVREYTTLGFFPAEEAYQTINAILSKDVGKLSGRVSPVAGAFLDWWYGKDSFYGRDFGNYLPNRYAEIIPKKLQETLGLTSRMKPKYRGGEVVGEEEVLYGDVDTVFMIRRLPLSSRFIADAAAALETGKVKGKPGAAALGYTTGIKAREMDIEKRKSQRKEKEEREIIKKAKSKGAAEFTRPYIPKWQKELSPREQILQKRKEFREKMRKEKQ